MEQSTTVNCYQCKESPSISGELFPFCGSECKEIWAAAHYQGHQSKQKPKTIEELQQKILDWRKSVRSKKLESNIDPNARLDNNQTYDVAKMIFG